MKNKQDIKIMEYLRHYRSGSAQEIADAVDCSTSTVRRRLTVLSDMGLVYRTHGGATINDGETTLPAFAFRQDRNKEVKKRIALASYKLIKDGDVVFLDDSSTAYYIIPYLTELENILVVTNGVQTLDLLSKYKIPAISTGGRTDVVVPSALGGEFAVNMVKNMFYDVSFMTALCINSDGVVSDVSHDLLPVKRTVIKNSKQSVLLFDSEKFDKTSVYKWFEITDFDVVISDLDLKSIMDEDKLCKTIIKA